MLTMQNAWERQLHNGRYSNGDSSDYVSQRQQQQQQQQRQIGPDRSISAPPPSSFNLSYNNNLQDDSTLFSIRQHEVSRNKNLNRPNNHNRSYNISEDMNNITSSPYKQQGILPNNHALREDLDFDRVTRSQSAAPNIAPPPGMGGHIFDSVSDILQTGMRRPASTGVIGSSAESSISRPIPKTLMELIQEDFPKTPSPEYTSGIGEYGGNRPRSASPPRSKTFLAPAASGNQEYRKEGQYYNEERSDAHVSHNNPQVIAYVQQAPQAAAPAPQTQYVSIPVSQLQHNGSVTVQAAQHVYPVTSIQQHPPHYDIQPVYYTTQRGANGATETIPVYVNPAPYYTVQYASHENPQILHHHPSHHPISIVPIHHSPNQPQPPQMAVNNGNYSYWHPEIPSQPYMTSQPHKQYKKQPKEKKRPNKPTKKQPSSLLEEFRSSKPHAWTISLIKNHILQFCQDQNGSRFIQQQLETTASSDEKQLVLKEILPSLCTLRNDVFGNYVIQKLLEYGTESIKRSLYATFQNEMIGMSLQMYGCRVVQKAFETLPYIYLTTLLNEFHDNVTKCIHDQNGNHVIQKIIEVMSFKVKLGEGEIEVYDFILQDVLAIVSELSCHPYGCRVMQRILEHCVEEQKEQALNCISCCFEHLLDDQYGNYVIQHVLQFGRDDDRNALLQIILSRDLLTLSRQKFASNVVEKLLKYGSTSQRNIVVNEMLKEVDGCSVVLWMVRDAYANYVVQTTLDVLHDGGERDRLMEELNCHSTQLRNFTFAKHIVAKLNDK